MISMYSCHGSDSFEDVIECSILRKLVKMAIKYYLCQKTIVFNKRIR